jgi:hypothetical protein
MFALSAKFHLPEKGINRSWRATVTKKYMYFNQLRTLNEK